LADALRGHDGGTVEPDGDVLVPEAALRRLAGVEAASEGRALDEAWESEFTGMLAYAATKGWVTEDGAVRVHVEWRD
jgi:hypothetical protein